MYAYYPTYTNTLCIKIAKPLSIMGCERGTKYRSSHIIKKEHKSNIVVTPNRCFDSRKKVSKKGINHYEIKKYK